MSGTELAAYAAARELHETRANHLAIVEAEIAAFWAEVNPSPRAVSDEAAVTRTRRLARLMAERGAVVVVERQAYEALVAAISRLVVTLPREQVRAQVEQLLDSWPTQEAGLDAMDAGAATTDTAHRALIGAACALLDPLVAQRSPFAA